MSETLLDCLGRCRAVWDFSGMPRNLPGCLGLRWTVRDFAGPSGALLRLCSDQTSPRAPTNHQPSGLPRGPRGDRGLMPRAMGTRAGSNPTHLLGNATYSARPYARPRRFLLTPHQSGGGCAARRPQTCLGLRWTVFGLCWTDLDFAGTSGTSPDCLELRRTARDFAGLPGTLLGSLRLCWTVWGIAGLSGTLRDFLRPCWTVRVFADPTGTLLERLGGCPATWDFAGLSGRFLRFLGLC